MEKVRRVELRRHLLLAANFGRRVKVHIKYIEYELTCALLSEKRKLTIQFLIQYVVRVGFIVLTHYKLLC